MVQRLLNSKYEKIKEKYKSYQDKSLSIIKDKLYKLDIRLYDEIVLFLKGSKNIRSLILYLICLLYDTKIDKNIIKIGIITELIHNASLLHDDVVDDCDIRRGILTFNKKYDNKFACLLGDYMLTLAVNEMLSLNCARIEKNFNRAINHMCIGEIEQYQDRYKIITMKKYIQKCIRKTSLLYEAACYAFCCLYIKDYKKAIKIVKFARYFGIAFQIKDDLNNIFDENYVKPKLNDIKNGIYNSNAIFASYYYPDLFNKSEEEYINILKNEKYINKSKKLIEKYVKKAEKALETINNSTYKEDLFTILDMFML